MLSAENELMDTGTLSMSLPLTDRDDNLFSGSDGFVQRARLGFSSSSDLLVDERSILSLIPTRWVD
jgi:hypothetical protein